MTGFLLIPLLYVLDHQRWDTDDEQSDYGESLGKETGPLALSLPLPTQVVTPFRLYQIQQVFPVLYHIETNCPSTTTTALCPTLLTCSKQVVPPNILRFFLNLYLYYVSF